MGRHRPSRPNATLWQEGAPLIARNLGARAFIPVALAATILFTLAPSTPAAATTTTTEAQQIIQIAKWQLGDPWRYGATGPYAFDCSGLVIYAFKRAGDGAVIRTGSLRSARSIYLYFKARGQASRTNPRIGDLVIWGGGTHIGIYIGGGRAISTLTNGVRIHGVFAVTARFTAYLHTGLSTRAAT
jgi:cell wall-associated NlpC family hydrolase